MKSPITPGWKGRQPAAFAVGDAVEVLSIRAEKREKLTDPGQVRPCGRR